MHRQNIHFLSNARYASLYFTKKQRKRYAFIDSLLYLPIVKDKGAVCIIGMSKYISHLRVSLKI